MNQEAIKERLVSAFGAEVIQGAVLFADQMAVTVVKDKILDVCRFLKTDPDLAFDLLSFVGGVDRHPASPRFEVVYQLYSMRHKHRFRIKAMVEEEQEGLGTIDSVVELWPTASWHDRETAEMFGIEFTGHPDPRKLLLPEEWHVYPLRKDFPVEGTEDTPDLPAAQIREG